MPPIYKNLENKSFVLKFKENITSKIIDTKDCNNRSDKKLLNQVLKNQEVEWLIKVKMEKGVIKINTFIKIYLSE